MSVVKQMPGPKLERKRKKIIETFKKVWTSHYLLSACCTCFRYSILSTNNHIENQIMTQ